MEVSYKDVKIYSMQNKIDTLQNENKRLRESNANKDKIIDHLQCSLRIAMNSTEMFGKLSNVLIFYVFFYMCYFV